MDLNSLYERGGFSLWLPESTLQTNLTPFCADVILYTVLLCYTMLIQTRVHKSLCASANLIRNLQPDVHTTVKPSKWHGCRVLC